MRSKCNVSCVSSRTHKTLLAGLKYAHPKLPLFKISTSALEKAQEGRKSGITENRELLRESVCCSRTTLWSLTLFGTDLFYCLRITGFWTFAGVCILSTASRSSFPSDFLPMGSRFLTGWARWWISGLATSVPFGFLRTPFAVLHIGVDSIIITIPQREGCVRWWREESVYIWYCWDRSRP